MGEEVNTENSVILNYNICFYSLQSESPPHTQANTLGPFYSETSQPEVTHTGTVCSAVGIALFFYCFCLQGTGPDGVVPIKKTHSNKIIKYTLIYIV